MRSASNLVTVATAYVDCASSECDCASSAMDCAYRQLHADYFGRSGSIRNERDALRVDVREKTKKTTKKVKLDNNDGMSFGSL